MAHHPSLRQKAVELRATEGLTIDQLAARLALPRTTIYSWVRGIPIPRVRRASPGQRKGNRRMQLAWKRKRDAAYAAGVEEFAKLAEDPTFRDFVCMYIGEGSKRCRNVVAIANSDPNVVLLGDRWISRLASNKVTYSVQYHADQDLREVCAFWSDLLQTDPGAIRLQRKSNSNGLTGRKWRSRYGVLTVCSNDTYLRARLQAWMDLIEESWV